MESWIGKIDGGKFINLKPYFEGVELKDIKNFFTKDDIIACVPSQRRALAIAFYNYIHDNYQSIKSSFIVSQPEFKAIPLTNIVKGLVMDDEFKHFSECGKIAVSDWVTKFTKYDKNEIEVLDLSENLLSDKSVKLLTQFISECPNLKYIDLSFNRLRQESWMYILQILQNENIQFINFIGNFGIFYENKHKEAFSQIDINLVKKMIWIHKHNLNLEDLSTIIENPDMEDLIYNTHRLFFDHFL